MNLDRPPFSILYLNDYLHNMGGAEKNLIQLLEGIDKSRFRPIVCCLSGGPLASELKEKGYTIYNLSVKRIYDLHGIKALTWLVKLIKKNRIKLIVSYHEGSDFLGLMAAKISDIRIISNRRDMGFQLKRAHIGAYRFCNNHFDKIIAVSDAVRRVIASREKTALNKIVTIHNAVDVELFSRNYGKKRIRSALGISDHQHIVGMIAGLRRIKGHKYFIQAASKVVNEIPDVKFLIIGKDNYESGCSEKDLMDLARNLGVSRHLIFTGETEDIPELLSVMDIVVSSSLSEGMSNTILEAMAAGKTVIASDAGGNPEIIKDHETGFLFPPGDTKMLSKLIIDCLKDSQQTKVMGQKAQKFTKDHHDLSLMCERNMDLYMKCIGYRLSRSQPS